MYEKLEPFGQQRNDYLLGTLAAQFYNVNKAKGAEDRMWYDFAPNVYMPVKTPEEETKSVEQLNAEALAWVAAHNARVAAQEQRTKEAKAVAQKFAEAGAAQRGGS